MSTSGPMQPYGQYPYGQQPYGQQPADDRRPGTVTAAAWITIVFSGISAALFGFTGLGLFIARDQVITEMERVPEFQDANIDADAAVGVLVAVILGLVVWAIIAIVLAVLVMRRSNVARILLVISSAVVALFSLLGVTSGVSAITLVAAIAVIVLLFVGGAGDWFKGPSSSGAGAYPGYAGQSGDPYGNQYGNQYGSQPGQPSSPQYPPPPSSSPYGQDDPYGQAGQAGQDSQDNPYGQPRPSDDGGSEHPPRDYPGR
jgi:hypothetical protein